MTDGPAPAPAPATSTIHTIPARYGIAVPLKAGQTVKVINTHGTQVVDAWAFTTSAPAVSTQLATPNPNPNLTASSSSTSAPSPSPSSASSASQIIQTQLSMPHTRASLGKISPLVGDGLYSNERRKMLVVVGEEHAGLGGEGIHDTLMAACDRWRYAELGAEEGHRNCADNLTEALEGIGIKPPQFTPSPLNLFMNVPVHPDLKSLSFEAAACNKGQSINLKAEVDLVIAFSACPQDLLKINGGEPKDAHYQIF